MSFGESKVYFDGSHYIAIPHTTRQVLKRPQKPEEMITVIEEKDCTPTKSVDVPSLVNTVIGDNKLNNANVSKVEKENSARIEKRLTKKEFFNELYYKYINLSRKERKNAIIEEMLSYFKNLEHCEQFVNVNLERKQRNLICRKTRMVRKANLANFNYFCTFTYDDKLHTEASFKKKLQSHFKNLCHRKGWKYMGVWERAPKTNRLHFHGLFYIPDTTWLGLVSCKDYDTKSHKMQLSNQSTYFNERFGRSDFKYIDVNEQRLGNALAYLMKYIEKTGEKLVYSKGLPQYFISDIMSNDIVSTIGQEDKKLLLFDDFTCIDEGEIIGNVNPEIIEQMRKSN